MRHCKFNPLKNAELHCEKCNIDLCKEYSEEVFIRRGEEPSYLCYICDSAMTKIANTTKIEPFWRKLDSIYKYPFSRPSSIAVILVTSFLTTVFKGVSLLPLLPWIMIVHYSFACLRETAQGELIAPSFEQSVDGAINPIFYVYGVLFIAFFLTATMIGILGKSLALLFGLLCIFALPASILIIAIDQKFFPALNPAKLIGIIGKTGSSYFVMILFIIIMMSSVALIKYNIGELAFTKPGLFLQTVVSNYYSIVIFHIMGYLVFQHHEQLGFKIKNKTNNSPSRDRENVQNSKIEFLIKAGRYKAAFDECELQIRRSNSEWHRTRHFKLACIACPPNKLSEHANSYFKFLKKSGKENQIADAFILAINTEPKLHMNNPQLSLDIAEQLESINNHKYIVLLLRDFHQHCQDKTLLSQAFAKLAKAYKNLPGQEKKAAFYKKLAT